MRGDGRRGLRQRQGTWRNPTGILITLGGTFGGPAKRASRPAVKKEKPSTLPQEVLAYIRTLDDKMLTDWIVKAAFDDYDFAGPDDEDTMKDRSDYAKETFGKGGVGKLGARKVAGLVAEEVQRMAAFQGNANVALEYELAFVAVHDTKTLGARLDALVKGLAAKMPDASRAVSYVQFACQRAGWSHNAALQ